MYKSMLNIIIYFHILIFSWWIQDAVTDVIQQIHYKSPLTLSVTILIKRPQESFNKKVGALGGNMRSQKCVKVKIFKQCKKPQKHELFGIILVVCTCIYYLTFWCIYCLHFNGLYLYLCFIHDLFVMIIQFFSLPSVF